jgi:hypothetical protein
VVRRAWVHRNHACDVVRVGLRVQENEQRTQGVAHEQVRTRQSFLSEDRMQVGDQIPDPARRSASGIARAEAGSVVTAHKRGSGEDVRDRLQLLLTVSLSGLEDDRRLARDGLSPTLSSQATAADLNGECSDRSSRGRCRLSTCARAVTPARGEEQDRSGGDETTHSRRAVCALPTNLGIGRSYSFVGKRPRVAATPTA